MIREFYSGKYRIYVTGHSRGPFEVTTSAFARTDRGRLGHSVSRSRRCSGKYCNRRLPNIKPQVHGCAVLQWTCCGRRCSWPALRYNPTINSILFHCFREFWIDSRNTKTVIPQLLVAENQTEKSVLYAFAPCILM
jgi:hypothetical protein